MGLLRPVIEPSLHLSLKADQTQPTATGPIKTLSFFVSLLRTNTSSPLTPKDAFGQAKISLDHPTKQLCLALCVAGRWEGGGGGAGEGRALSRCSRRCDKDQRGAELEAGLMG